MTAIRNTPRRYWLIGGVTGLLILLGVQAVNMIGASCVLNLPCPQWVPALFSQSWFGVFFLIYTYPSTLLLEIVSAANPNGDLNVAQQAVLWILDVVVYYGGSFAIGSFLGALYGWIVTHLANNRSDRTIP